MMLSSDDVRKLLRAACDKAGGQKVWAAGKAGVSASHVNDVLHSRKEPAEAICKALGLERIVLYKRKSRKK